MYTETETNQQRLKSNHLVCFRLFQALKTLTLRSGVLRSYLASSRGVPHPYSLATLSF